MVGCGIEMKLKMIETQVTRRKQLGRGRFDHDRHPLQVRQVRRNGREGGTWGIEDFIEVKSISGWTENP